MYVCLCTWEKDCDINISLGRLAIHEPEDSAEDASNNQHEIPKNIFLSTCYCEGLLHDSKAAIYSSLFCTNLTHLLKVLAVNLLPRYLPTYCIMCRYQCFGSVSGWIRIHIAAWIRIRIRYTDPDP